MEHFFMTATPAPVEDDEYVRLLAKAIRRERTKRGFAQEAFALQAGVERAYMGRVERGELNVTFAKLMVIMDELHVDWRDFFSEIRFPAAADTHSSDNALEPSSSPSATGDDYIERLGAAIQHERRLAGVSQEELAGDHGLARSYLSGLESGRRNPTFTVLMRVLRGLGVQPSDFFQRHFGREAKPPQLAL